MSEVYKHEYTQVENVVDGDTIDVYVDHGFRNYSGVRTRLLGVDTHEIHNTSRDSEEYKKGKAEQQFVIDWCVEAEVNHDGRYPFVLHTEKASGKYGRWLALVERKHDGEILNERLVDEFGEELIY